MAKTFPKPREVTIYCPIEEQLRAVLKPGDVWEPSGEPYINREGELAVPLRVYPYPASDKEHSTK